MYSSKTFYSGLYFCIPMFVLMILSGILIFLGFLCFIVPGLYLLVACLFTHPLLLEYYDEHISIENTIRMSIKVVSKHFWWFVFFEILTFFLAISGILLLGVGIFITIPVAQLAVLVAFKDIFGLNPDRQPDGTFYYVCGKSNNF